MDIAALRLCAKCKFPLGKLYSAYQMIKKSGKRPDMMQNICARKVLLIYRLFLRVWAISAISETGSFGGVLN